MSSTFGLIGLGVMGQNFVLNVEGNGFSCSVYNRSGDRTKTFIDGPANGRNIEAAYDLKTFCGSLERPRRIMLLIKAGKPVDSTIEQLIPYLESGDIIIDGGNSFYRDSERRSTELQERDIQFVGMGVSGGEEGALRGPSLMPGGSLQAYTRLQPLLQKVAAKAAEDGAACVAFMGPRGAGHYVKMVHNGIEYGDMQLIAEAYDILHRALGLSAEEFSGIFSEWNKGELSSFLIEITVDIFRKLDEKTGMPLIDIILDKAGQKGTGKWTSMDSLDLGSAVPTITAAVDGRILSSRKEERVRAAKKLSGPLHHYKGESSRKLIDSVRDALYASKICSYAQGMGLLGRASIEYGYDIELSSVARIWRAGCIIRARLLQDIAEAYQRNPALPDLLVDDSFRDALAERQDNWRFVVSTAVSLGIPVPATSASLAYYDSYRSPRLPANLIQAQRDYFGAHTFERTDTTGTFHADW